MMIMRVTKGGYDHLNRLSWFNLYKEWDMKSHLGMELVRLGILGYCDASILFDDMLERKLKINMRERVKERLVNTN
jgi:hypothetical protein